MSSFSSQNRESASASVPKAALLRELLDASPNVVIYWANRHQNQQQPERPTDFICQFANSRASEIIHQSPEKLIEQPLSKCQSPVWPTTLLQDCFAVFNSQKPAELEHCYPSPMGDRWLSITITPLAEGVMTTLVDITAYKQAETTVRNDAQLIHQGQTQVLQAILDNSQTGISLHEPVRNEQGQVVDFKAILANRQALMNWGSKAEAILNQSLLTVYPGLRDSEEFARYVRVLETGQADSFEYNSDDQVFAITVASADGGVVISAVDVTTDRQYRHELEIFNRTLQQSNDNLQQFAYVASHDLQEPLRKIQTFTDVLQNQFEDNLSEGERDMAQRIQKSARRMQSLIKDLLTYSSIATQRDPGRLVSLSQVITDVVSDLEININEKRATIQVGVLPTLLGNASRLRQLMQNLLVNALKFTQAGRPPVIQINAQPAQPEELPNELPSTVPFWLISVADNGMGFDERYKERIFQLFQRLDNSPQTGTGIGLAICQRVVENHGGAVDVTSQPGIGTIFKIFLPVYQQSS